MVEVTAGTVNEWTHTCRGQIGQGGDTFVMPAVIGAEADLVRLEEMRSLFMKYGKKYHFDWIALAAVGYQKSRLRQNRRSEASAVGVMQLKPSTAADENVAIIPIDTIDTIENNIHAATKYLAFLRDRYFSDSEIPNEARFDFTLAADNAGPARIARLRCEAADKGYDPNLWLFNQFLS